MPLRWPFPAIFSVVPDCSSFCALGTCTLSFSIEFSFRGPEIDLSSYKVLLERSPACEAHLSNAVPRSSLVTCFVLFFLFHLLGTEDEYFLYPHFSR